MNAWSLLPPALAAFGVVLANGRLAPAQSAREDPTGHGPRRVALAGVVLPDGPDAYAIRRQDGHGFPPAVTTYRLVTAHAGQPPALSRSLGRAVVAVGRVGERADDLYLFLESFREIPTDD